MLEYNVKYRATDDSEIKEITTNNYFVVKAIFNEAYAYVISAKGSVQYTKNVTTKIEYVL